MPHREKSPGSVFLILGLALMVVMSISLGLFGHSGALVVTLIAGAMLGSLLTLAGVLALTARSRHKDNLVPLPQQPTLTPVESRDATAA